MAASNRTKLKRATIVYWVLLLYIIAALVWWAFSLLQLNDDIYRLEKERAVATQTEITPPKPLDQIEDQRRRNITKYVSEGSIFLLFILVGAAFVFRSVRRQLRQQQQEQNFVMAITHELKTPIAISKLNLETLQRHQLDETKRSRLLNNSLQETQRLETLINNILISAQLDGRSYKLSWEEINFSALVRDVAQQFAGRYTDRPLELQIEEEVELSGDPLLLKLLVSNLLENANKYAPPATKVVVHLHKQKDAVVLKVEDEGPGIVKEEKSKIFEKFYRIGSEETRSTKGTGLGLYLCKKIAADHQAVISVEDNLPAGSTFIVQFKR
jgi:two-component system, OmpR family, sensor histidine kinase CiaH